MHYAFKMVNAMGQRNRKSRQKAKHGILKNINKWRGHSKNSTGTLD